MISTRPIAFLIAFLLVAHPSLAEDESEAWTPPPPPPMPEKYDWVQLTSGEWLKGEIIALYEDKLEFDSDELDLQSFDWEDVKELRSANPMEIGLDDRAILIGRILVTPETVRVMGDADRQIVRSEIVAITAGSPRERDNWSIKASVGANLRKGNSEEIETTGKVKLVRRTAVNRTILEYLASFSETDGSTTADNQRANATWNRFISTRVFWAPFQGEWYRDPFKNIASRWTAGLGLGYELVNSSRVDWDLNTGVSYQHTRFDDVAEGDREYADSPSFMGATKIAVEVIGSMDYDFEYTFHIVNEESGQYTHHMVTGFEIDITRLFDLDFTVIWDRTQKPQQNSEGVVPKKDDLQMVFSFGFDY